LGRPSFVQPCEATMPHTSASELPAPAFLIADDHPMFREALHWVVGEISSHYQVYEVPDFQQAMDVTIRQADVEMIFLDLNMPDMNGLEGLIALRNATPATPIIIVSATEDVETIREAMVCGASGYIPKSLSKSEMVAAVRSVLDGEVFVPVQAGSAPRQSSDGQLEDGISKLTNQQRVVLQLLVSGQSNKQIAYELGTVESTVKAHVSAILRKLKVHSRTQAVIKAAKILAVLGCD